MWLREIVIRVRVEKRRIYLQEVLVVRERNLKILKICFLVAVFSGPLGRNFPRQPTWNLRQSTCSRQKCQQSWALSVFLNFFNNKKLFFAFFIKLIWLGVGFLNRTGAEIGYYLHKNAKKIFFIIEKIQIYRKCPALGRTKTKTSINFEAKSPKPFRNYFTGFVCSQPNWNGQA